MMKLPDRGLERESEETNENVSLGGKGVPICVLDQLTAASTAASLILALMQGWFQKLVCGTVAKPYNITRVFECAFTKFLMCIPFLLRHCF